MCYGVSYLGLGLGAAYGLGAAGRGLDLPLEFSDDLGEGGQRLHDLGPVLHLHRHLLLVQLGDEQLLAEVI